MPFPRYRQISPFCCGGAVLLAALMLSGLASVSEAAATEESSLPLPLDVRDSTFLQALLANCTFQLGPGAFPRPLDRPKKNSSIYSPLGSYQYLQFNYNCSSTGTPIDEYWAQQQAINTPNTRWDWIEAGRPDTQVPTPLDLRATFASFYNTFVISFFWGFANSTQNLYDSAKAFPATYPPGPGGGGLLEGYTLQVRYIPSIWEDILGHGLRLFGVPQSNPLGSETFASVLTFDITNPQFTAGFIFAATRGNSLCELLTDLNYNAVRYIAPRGLPECRGCAVHQGFYAAFLTLLNQSDPNNLYNSWVRISGNNNPASVTRVLCGGHSLGAAMAQLCALWAKATFPNAYIDVWQSGAPRVGNPAWARYFDSLIPPVQAPRLVDNRDPVPTVPFPIMPGFPVVPSLRPIQRFQHVGLPYFMYRNGSRLPGVYWGYQEQRAPLYNDLNRILDQSFQPGGFWYDHVYGYTLGLRQLIQNCPPNAVV
eukprot:jgi/Botrbrau1/5137/Bobra.0172s0009.1